MNGVVPPQSELPSQPVDPGDEHLRRLHPHSFGHSLRKTCRAEATSSRTALARAEAVSARLMSEVSTTSASVVPGSAMYRLTNALASK